MKGEKSLLLPHSIEEMLRPADRISDVPAAVVHNESGCCVTARQWGWFRPL